MPANGGGRSGGVPSAPQSLPVVRSFTSQHDQSDSGPAIVTGDAALIGLGALVAAALLIIPATASPAGASSLTADAIVEVRATAALSGTGSLTGIALLFIPATATLSGSSSLASSGLVQELATSTVPGTSALAADSFVIVLATASLPGSSSLIAVGDAFVPAPIVTGTATLTAASLLTADAVTFVPTPASEAGGALPYPIDDSPRVVTAAVQFRGRSGLKAIGLVDAQVAALLEGGADLRTWGRVTTISSADPVGRSGLTASGQVFHNDDDEVIALAVLLLLADDRR